ncbi:hypothetical protein Y032_0056g2708 [Ancylostoma ceylanicum]|uniref:Uncharacterized protein n=1 Tax=Ancylostoma ceylanicum TaxID=53326 RepID=A0A016U6X6_9BILA|nr:hypothetical protein Y032_0056g2708 [Ancylostoma ceylanicum]
MTPFAERDSILVNTLLVEVAQQLSVINFIACSWAIIFGIGCCLRVHFAYHWNGYLHVLMPFFGFGATVGTILGYTLEPKYARKCVLGSTIAWILCILAALGLIIRSGFVYASLKENKTIEGFRSFFLYLFLWIFFTDLLCILTMIIDGFAVFAGYKMWKAKAAPAQ